MDIEIILGFLFVAILLVACANKLKVPYPVLLVLAGLLISLIPGLPTVELAPNVVFLVFLPPIIQLSAYDTPIRDFRQNLRGIGLLAIGLVLATMAAVAVVAHQVLPGLPWAAAFALGAIVAPTDSIAATSIAQRLKLPRRIVTLLEGESLLNDATALVAFRGAVVAAVSGTFSLVTATGQFLVNSIGGIAIGILVALVMTPIFRRLTKDIPVYLMLTFLSGYGAYILADALQLSGVLAVVALGIIYGLPRFSTMTPETRMQGVPVWQMVVFALNSLIFILLGLQLRSIIRDLPAGATSEIIRAAIVICVTLIVIRIVWVMASTYLPRLPFILRGDDGVPPWQHMAVVSWAGMRGGVSLATALSLPLVVSNQMPFPARSTLIFITFCVILGTLVVQGLSLPALIKGLKIVDDGASEREEYKARLMAARAAHNYLKERTLDEVPDVHLEKLLHQYENRIRRYSGRYHDETDGEVEEHFNNFAALQCKLIRIELDAVTQLRNAQVINDEVLRKVQYDLDLEWLRLQDAKSE